MKRNLARTPMPKRKREHKMHHRRVYRYLITAIAEFITVSKFEGEVQSIKVAELLEWNKKQVEKRCDCPPEILHKWGIDVYQKDF